MSPLLFLNNEKKFDVFHQKLGMFLKEEEC